MEDLSGLAGDEKLIYSMIAKYGVMFARAQIVDVKGTAAKIAVEGSTLDMYYPMLKQTYEIADGDWVECLKVGEGYLILGSTAVANDVGDPRESLQERIDTLEGDVYGVGGLMQFKANGPYLTTAAFANHNSSSDHDERYLRKEGIGGDPQDGQGYGKVTMDGKLDNKAGSGHEHPWSEVNGKPNYYPPELHGNGRHSPNFIAQGEAEWSDLPNNGVHDNTRHNPNFQPL